MSQMPPLSPGPSAPPSGSNRTLWIILGSCLGGGLLLTICAAILVVGSLSILGRRTSSVFNQINSGLVRENSNGFVLPTAAPVEVSAALPIGTSGRSGDLELQVIDTTTEVGDSLRQPQPGNEFRVITVQAINRGAQPLDLDRLLLSWVQQGTTGSYECCVFALMPNFDFTQEIAPGATSEIRLVFEVPGGSDPLYWVYEERQTEATPLVVELR